MEGMNEKELNAILYAYPDIKRDIQRVSVKKYDQFIELLHEDINDCIEDLQSSKVDYQDEFPKDKTGEDRISRRVIKFMRDRKYRADAKFINGNADIVIEHKIEKFVWIGEAKLVSGKDAKYIWKGFDQLTTRYDDGASKEKVNGGVFVYVFGGGLKQVMDDFRAFTKEKQDPVKFKKYLDCKITPGGFYAVHEHQVSGLDYTTRFIPITFYFKPKDRKKDK